MDVPNELQSSLNDLASRTSETPDAFLLYNSKQPEIPTLVRELRRRGLEIWYSQDSLDTGDDWDGRETRVLRAARTVLIVLGSEGWGTYQLAFVNTALERGKQLIPVVVGAAPPDALAAAGGLFHRLKRAHLTSATDEKALDELLASVRRVIERNNDRNHAGEPQTHGLPLVEPALILDKLVSGASDDRDEALDDLGALAESYDCEPLWRAILAELHEHYQARAGEQHEKAAIRATLLRALPALVPTLDSPQPEPLAVVETLEAALAPETEPSEEVRWATLVGLLRFDRYAWVQQKLDACTRDGADVAALGYVWTVRSGVRQRGRETPVLNDLREAILGTGGAPSSFLRALTVIAIPELTRDLVARLIAKPDPQVLLSLAHEELDDALAAHVIDDTTLRSALAAGCSVIAQGGRYLARRVARMLSRLPRGRVVPILNALADGHTPDATGARRLLDLLGDPDRLFVAGYRSDGGRPPDDLQVGVDVQTLCAVILAKKVEPPLSIGLFGDWGTGKSYFMDAMEEKLESMASDARRDGREADFHTTVAQIRFNAWHYIDANLWASLVSHIIEELTVRLKPNDPAGARKELVTKLETAKQIKQDAENERTRATAARTEAETALGTAAKERVEKQLKLGDLRAKDLWGEVSKDVKLQKALKTTTETLGLPKTLANVQELEAAVAEAHTLAGRLRALFVELPKSTSRLTLVVLMVVLIAGAPVAVWALDKFLLTNKPFAASVSAVFAEVAAVAATLVHALKGPLKNANEGLAALTRAKARALKLIADERNKRSEGEMALEKEVNELLAKEQNAVQQLASAEMRVQEITARIKELDEGQSFSKYLLERLQADDYRRHLGIVSTIRRDFGQLEKLLKEAARNTQTEPIQRMVLYIDDLDRCPEDRVLEVLQAVHLLLAFKLFVVVVGVDPRWLLHSLERSYSAFRPARARGKEWRTTPQNYLEKIFQIPFSLKPMSEDGFKRLMKTLLPVTHAGGTGANTRLESVVHAPPAPTVAAPPGGASLPGGSAPFARPAPVPHAQDMAPSRAEDATSRSEQGKEVVPAPPVNYAALRILEREHEFAQRLHELVPSPRAAKRVTNVYRLLKARLRGNELTRFEGSGLVPGEFPAVMLLLGILAGFPESAPKVFRRLLAAGTDLPTGVFFHELGESVVLERDRDDFTKHVRPLLGAMPPTLKPFVEWAPHVARFSFATARSLD